MLTLSSIRPVLTTVSLLVCMVPHMHGAHADEIAFDLPSSIECRDVTSKDFAIVNPHLKQIEAKVRISAREIEGATAEIVQFDYEIRIGNAVRVIDYLPKTLLESSVVEDQIDITAAAEDSQANGTDASIAYKPLIVGGSHNTTAKKSEAKHFKRLTPKDVVLASGTIEREHGVFFRVRPSRSAAFEGAREFVLIAAVPRGWRADVCQISCTARVSKHSMMTVSVASIGGKRTRIGMYIVGDLEAAATAEQLRRAQDLYQQVLAGRERKSNLFEAISTGASAVFARGAVQRKRLSIEEATKSLDAIQDHLKLLSASSPSGE